jgi:hypothetical protein
MAVVIVLVGVVWAIWTPHLALGLAGDLGHVTIVSMHLKITIAASQPIGIYLVSTTSSSK